MILTFIGITAVILTMSGCLGIAIGKRIKAVNDTRDEHAQGHGIGGGADFFQHVERK